jgi:hypothetical protein
MERQKHQWKDEFSAVHFGDKRLKFRFIHIANRLSQQPMASINQAHTDWATTKAAYRFFKNDKVETKRILQAHQACTAERAKEHGLILAVQDTTFFNYNSHPKTTGLGSIMKCGSNASKGLVMHSTIALTSEGFPLGILQQQIWARDPKRSLRKDPHLAKRYKKLPPEKKESGKWFQGLKETLSIMPKSVRVVTVADRESDIYDFVVEAMQQKAELLVRVCRDKVLKKSKQKLWVFMAQKQIEFYTRVIVPPRNGQEKREAKLAVRFSKVDLTPPVSAHKKEEVTVYMVFVKEVNPPDGMEALEWMLLSTSPVVTKEEAMERIDWYKVRWSIEQYHRVLKSGCRVEDCKLSTADRLERYLTLMSIVAWRIYWLTHMNRSQAEESCDAVLADHEWKSLYCKINKTGELPKEKPTVRQVTRWIAQLGGFLGRKGDGEPGPTVIWRGWQRLTDIADTWLILRPTQLVGNCEPNGCNHHPPSNSLPSREGG